MQYKLLTYPNKNKETPSFYIQVKGNHSGRPLRKSIRNCVAVYSDFPFLFEIVFLLFSGRMFEQFIIGSVVPFIRIDDLKRVIDEGTYKYTTAKRISLKQINDIDKALINYQEQIKVLKQLQIAICQQFLR